MKPLSMMTRVEKKDFADRLMQSTKARRIERDIETGRTRAEIGPVAISAAEPGQIVDFVVGGGPRTNRAIMVRLAAVARMLGSLDTFGACELAGCDRRTLQRVASKCRGIPQGQASKNVPFLHL